MTRPVLRKAISVAAHCPANNHTGGGELRRNESFIVCLCIKENIQDTLFFALLEKVPEGEAGEGWHFSGCSQTPRPGRPLPGPRSASSWQTGRRWAARGCTCLLSSSRSGAGRWLPAGCRWRWRCSRRAPCSLACWSPRWWRRMGSLRRRHRRLEQGSEKPAWFCFFVSGCLCKSPSHPKHYFWLPRQSWHAFVMNQDESV